MAESRTVIAPVAPGCFLHTGDVVVLGGDGLVRTASDASGRTWGIVNAVLETMSMASGEVTQSVEMLVSSFAEASEPAIDVEAVNREYEETMRSLEELWGPMRSEPK